jgi:hypothetical protein
MAEADYSMTDMAFSGENGRFKADDRLLVKFFMKPWLDQAKSNIEKRPIYVEKCYIEIRIPGNKDTVVCRPATSLDKQRFAEHFRKFEAREDQDAVVGTLLSEWPGINRSQVEELRFLNIKTVEQLATANDASAGRIMGFNGLKDRAAKFLETAAQNATDEALADAHKRIDELMALMEATPQPTEPRAEAEVAPDPVEEDQADSEDGAPKVRRRKQG